MTEGSLCISGISFFLLTAQNMPFDSFLCKGPNLKHKMDPGCHGPKCLSVCKGRHPDQTTPMLLPNIPASAHSSCLSDGKIPPLCLLAPSHLITLSSRSSIFTLLHTWPAPAPNSNEDHKPEAGPQEESYSSATSHAESSLKLQRQRRWDPHLKLDGSLSLAGTLRTSCHFQGHDLHGPKPSRFLHR